MDGRPPSHTGLIVPNATAHKYGNAPAPASHKCLNWFMTISFIANIFSSHCIYARHTFIIIRKFVRWCSIVVGCCSLPLWFIHRFVRFCVVVIVVVFFSFSFSRRTQTADRIKCSMRRSWERYDEYTTTNNIQRNDWDGFVYDAVIKNDTTLTHQYEAVRCHMMFFFLSLCFFVVAGVILFWVGSLRDRARRERYINRIKMHCFFFLFISINFPSIFWVRFVILVSGMMVDLDCSEAHHATERKRKGRD